jgi:uncharacterized protein
MPEAALPDTATAVAISAFRERLAQRYGARLRGLVLFGSRARGDFGPDSDADLAVFLEPVSDPVSAQMDMAGDAYAVFLDTGILIQPWAFGGSPARPARDRAIALLRAVETQGIPL